MQRNSLIPTAVASLALVLAAGSVDAGSNWGTYDRKTYTGAQCQPATGSQSSDFVIFAGTLRNMSGGLRWASCAITFDQEGTVDSTDTDHTTTAGALALRAYLDYSAVPAGIDFTTDCTVRSLAPSGASTTVSKSTTAQKTAGTVSVIFSTADLAPLDGMNIGNHVSLQMSCRLPAKAGIRIVKIYEYGQTGSYYYTP
jgi:hypothetical protein